MLILLYGIGKAEEAGSKNPMILHSEQYIKVTDWSFYVASSGETEILHVTLPPHTKKIYLEGGAVLGSGSTLFYADNLEVLGAVPLTDEKQPIKRSPKFEL